MTLTRKIFALTAPLALLTLSACETGFRANVSRFQVMPAPAGQSFTIQSSDPKLQGGLEFAQYAGLVRQQLEAKGYKVAEGPQAATLVVNLEYGVDNGQTKVVSRPSYPHFYGRYGWGHRYYWGWSDPFMYDDFFDNDIESYTVFTSYLKMTINRTSDNERLFEGTARARSSEDKLTKLVPNLVSAMFSNFPGNSGEDVKITIPPEKKR